MLCKSTIHRLSVQCGVLGGDAVTNFARAIEREVRQQALEDAAQWFLNEDNKRMFFSETLWPHQVAERLLALKDKP